MPRLTSALALLLLVATVTSAFADRGDRRRRGHGPRPPYGGGAHGGGWGGPDLDALRVVSAACDAAVYARDDRASCVQLGTRLAEPAGTIAACDAAMYYDRDVLACMQAAVGARGGFAATVAACDRAMYYDRDVLTCVATAAPTALPTSTIATCDRAMYYDRDVLQCVAAAAPFGRRADEFVAYCDQANYYDRDALTCLAQLARR